jgi:hypothetical protein
MAILAMREHWRKNGHSFAKPAIESSRVAKRSFDVPDSWDKDVETMLP